MTKTRRCLVCSNTNRSTNDVSYFRIPADQDYADKWFINLRRTDLNDSIGSRNSNGFICSDHFPPDRMFVSKSNDQCPVKRLKRGALPYKVTEFGLIEDTSEKSDVDGDADDSFDGNIADMLQQKMYSGDDPSGLDTTNGFADNEMSTNEIIDEDFNLDLFDDVDPKEIEQYKTHFPNLEKITDSKSHCTSCQFHIGTAPINEAIIKMHPILRVTQCKRCFTFYNSGEFERGEDGSELYCRWCGQGGEVYCCSNCPYVFCRRCIVQNLSRNMVTEIQNNENWNCFACAPQCMIPLRANHWALVNFIEKQKRQITNKSSDEKEINELMSKDISKCCSSSKKRFTLKRKVENTAVISPPPEKKKTISPNPNPPRILNTVLAKKAVSKAAPDADDSVVVQCTPDILSLFNSDEQVPSPNEPAQAPPLRLIRREVTIRPNQSGVKVPTPPPAQQPKPPSPPVPSPVQTPSTLPIHTLPATSNPVYHTINGFRIDLNTAAQQETYRLPNGKLIQVKKQTPNLNQTNSPAPERSPPVINRPQMLPVRPQSLPTNRPPSLPTNRPQVRNSVGGTVRVLRPNIFQVQTRPPPQIQNRMVGNNQIRLMNGPIIQPLNNPPTQQMNPSNPPPLVFRMGHGNTPVGKGRTQFEERVDSSVEVCQHIIGKINTLTNSSSYKIVKSLMDLKDLTIHLSYLLTYAIGRFKTLQEKCIEDMKNMGFDTENPGAPASDDDDIEIVEQKTTTINLDSDEEDEVPTAATNNLGNTTVAHQVEPVTNGDQNVENITNDKTKENKLDDDLTTKDNANDKINDTDNIDILMEVPDEPMDDIDATEKQNANNDEDIVQVIEITENDEEKSENETTKILDETENPDNLVKVVEDTSIEADKNIENESVHESKDTSESTDSTTVEKRDNEQESVDELTTNKVQTEILATDTNEIDKIKCDAVESKKDAENVMETTMEVPNDKVSEDQDKLTKENTSKDLVDNVDEIMPDLVAEHIKDIIPETPLEDVNIISEENKPEDDSKTPEQDTIESVLHKENALDNVSETSKSDVAEENVEKEILKIIEEKSVPDIPECSGITDDILTDTENKLLETISNMSKEDIIDNIPETAIDISIDAILEQSKDDIVDEVLSIADEILTEQNIVDEILAVAEIPDVPEENINDAISNILCDKLTDNICLPDDIDVSMCASTADDDKDSSALLDDIIMKTLEMDSLV